MDSPMIRAIVFPTLLGIAGGTEASSHTGFIQGSVSDTGGDPVANVAVEIVDTDASTVAATLTTNDSGEFGPVELPSGNYTARVDDPAWSTASATNVALDPGETVTISVTVEQLTGFIRGTAEDTAGDPIEGVDVEIVNTNTGSVAVTLTTDTSGEFGAVDLPAGDYTARIVDTGYDETATSVSLASNETESIQITAETLAASRPIPATSPWALGLLAFFMAWVIRKRLN